MKTVILCGGAGTRIRDVADDIPKPMIPVGGLPIVWHIMRYYAHFGHKEFVLCLGHKGHVIKDFFLNYRMRTSDITLRLDGSELPMCDESSPIVDWKVVLAETGLRTMTGGRVSRIKKYIGKDEEFFLTYGDGLGDIDVEKLLAFHRRHGKIMTVSGVRPPGRFGEMATDSRGVVTEFNEKPQASGGRINGGFFVCRREIFDYISDDESLVFEQEPIRALVRNCQLAMFEHDGFWQPMDTYREYVLLNDLVEKRNAPWMIW